ncbi:MAG: UbiA family prenyltransferase [Hyphomonadaceae bacterium]
MKERSLTRRRPGPAGDAATPADPPSAEAGRPMPLAVDLDGTLLLTDTLFEALGEHLRRRPLWALAQLVQLPFAIAKVKDRLTSGLNLDIATLPVNEDVLAYCREAKAEGREVWLVSAADQKVVDQVAARFGIFDRAIGSDGTTNNKGGAKARLLEREAPGGFEYVGDSPADIKVWARAKAASHVDKGEARKRMIERMGVPVARSFDRPKAGLVTWLKAMRLHQWAKNALIFVPAILAMKIDDLPTLMTLLMAMPLLGATASGAYILNDIVDLSTDRGHPTRRNRPFASGRIKLWQAFVAAPTLILVGLVGGFLLSPAFAATMLCYLIVALACAFALKRTALVDVIALAFLYTLRLIMGAVLASVLLSQWLMVVSMLLFVSLSLAKRHTEVLRRVSAGERRVANRGYRAEDVTLTLGLGLATATAAPLVLVLYIIESAWPPGHYASPAMLWVAPIALSIWLMRLWLVSNRSELNEDPVVFAVKDPQSLAAGAVLAASFAAASLLPEGSLELLNLNGLFGQTQ